MKLRYLLAAGLVTASIIASADSWVVLFMKSGTVEKIKVTLASVISMNEEFLSLHEQQIPITSIDHFTLIDEPTATTGDTIRVTYRGAAAPSVENIPEDVVATIEGADVTLTNTNNEKEYTYVLEGASAAGSFTLSSDYKSTVVLNGLSLQSTLKEALNLKCGKRVALVLADGTTNSLADATVDNGQHGAIYCKGHLELSGAGALTLTGNVKHALSTKEYLQIKKTFGSLHVTSAANDGIHAGQYFQMNGGEVTISHVGGDGIQAEATSTPDDELNGQILIKGGSLTITTSATDVAALKSDSLMTITGGTFQFTTTGAGNKAIKSKQALNISDGKFTITQSGKPCSENGDLGYVTAIKGTDVNITGGTFIIKTSGVGARGISAESLWIGDSADIDINNTGTGGTASDAVEVTGSNSGTTTGPEEQQSFIVYVNVPTSSQGGWGGPGGQQSGAWSSVYLMREDGTQVATLTQQVTVNGTTFYLYDFKKADNGTYYFGAPNYQSGGNWGGGTSYTIRSTTFTGPTSGKDRFYKIASSYSTSGTTRTYSLSDVTSTYEGGTIGSATTSDGFTAKGIKVDGNATLAAGKINITMSGAGGKGIKVEGNYIQGMEDGSGPVLTVATTGSSYGSTGSSTGGGRPGGQTSSGSSAKAIKVQGLITIYGGQSEVTTTSSGAEGLESKQKVLSAIRILGGQHYFHCYDDCINSAGGINFEGGVTVCYGYGNDAVDSNFGQRGAIVIGDGNILTYTTKGSPEEGLDCDNNSYIQITGSGNVVALGGAQGGGASSSLASATQGYILSTSSMSFAPNRYYTLADNTGNNLLTFSVEASFNSTMSLITATGMKASNSYTLKYSTTPPTDATTAWHGFYLGSSAQGSTLTSNLTAR